MGRTFPLHPPGSTRLLGLNDKVPTDACMVALYSYRLYSYRKKACAFEEDVVPAICKGVQLFQQVHLKWRDVDEAQNVKYEKTVVWRCYP